MEGIPTGDIQAKYQKLAAEYSKLRVHVKVLRKGVLDEQAKSNELREGLKEKDKALRKCELEIDSLTFRNQQLTRRVAVLQDELELLQVKQSKKSKNKGSDDRNAGNTSSMPPLDSGLLQEELQKKIIENAQFASQLSDRTFEVSQLKSALDDYQKQINECDSKYKCEIARLKNKNQELQFALEESHKERLGTPNKVNLPSSSQAASCNGDFMSEGGSLIGSEDALSSVDDINVNEQISMKSLTIEQENQKLKMEYELLKMENESLKFEVSKYTTQKRRGDHDSGDFNNFSETSMDGNGKVTGLLGSLEVPFVIQHEVELREERMNTYYRSKINELKVEKAELKSKTEHYVKECEMLRLRFNEMERDKRNNENTIDEKHKTISRLEDELHSTSHNYEQQMSALTEHVAGLSEQLTRQHDLVHHLKHQLGRRH